jgi:hypothetical protein
LGKGLAPYSEETVQRTITEGIDSAGNPLDTTTMSRWQLNAQDLDDLVA